MFYPRRVEQKGAIIGFIAGLVFISWIGFGGPKPPSTKLAVSVANCSVAVDSTTPVDTSSDSTEYFYLYRISYAWTCCIGFFVTLLVGTLVSELVRLTGATPGEVEPLLLAKVVRRVDERERHGKQFRMGDKSTEHATL